ncbi:MAG TPA: hypothetical protein VNZ61_20995 [Roseomonas sp.]|nr:hypothetical protein [Roseomonas sp.]
MSGSGEGADAAAIMRSMRQRMPWMAAQKALAAEGLPRGKGWDLTVAKLSASEALTSEQLIALRKILVEHEICGEKLVSFHRVDESRRAALSEALRSTDVEENAFTRLYPAVLSEEAIEHNFPHPLTLTAIVECGTGIAVVFSATRGLTFREEVDREGLPPAARDALAGYDELLGIKQEKRQTFDVVYVPDGEDLIDVRVDYPDGMLRGAAQAAQLQVCRAFNHLVGFEALGLPVNLFPLIDAMYRAPAEGTVVEIAFGTTTASTKFERMRRQHLCLREEVYHRAGSSALASPIEPFRLSIQWSVHLADDVFTRPELSFQSTQRMRDSENPELFGVVVRDTSGYQDFDYVKARLQHFLTALGEAQAVPSTDAAD